MKLRPGDTVRVKGERGTAKIRSIQAHVNGALLEKEIGGFPTTAYLFHGSPPRSG
jgi:hypothetical protein